MYYDIVLNLLNSFKLFFKVVQSTKLFDTVILKTANNNIKFENIRLEFREETNNSDWTFVYVYSYNFIYTLHICYKPVEMTHIHVSPYFKNIILIHRIYIVRHCYQKFCVRL